MINFARMEDERNDPDDDRTILARTRKPRLPVHKSATCNLARTIKADSSRYEAASEEGILGHEKTQDKNPGF